MHLLHKAMLAPCSHKSGPSVASDLNASCSSKNFRVRSISFSRLILFRSAASESGDGEISFSQASAFSQVAGNFVYSGFRVGSFA